MGEILSGMRKKAVLFVVALVMIAAIFPAHEVYATTENEQSPSVVVSDYSNLKYAIESANDGDVIGINGMIEVDNGYRLSLGDYGKTVTLLRMSQDAGIKIKNTEGCSFKYLILDGNRKSFPDAVPMLQIVNTQSFSMYGVEIKNCSSESFNGGAVLMTNRSNGEWRKCSFTDNNANKGGHISIEDCSELRIFESSFTEGQAEMGGAVYCSEYSYCSISDSILTGNQAEICGGGVCNYSSTISVCNTLIYGNAAKAGADIATQNESSPYFEDMDSLYETVGIKPDRWVNDYVAGTVDLPDWIVPDKENCLLKLEYSSIQDTEESEEEDEESNSEQEIETDENIPDIIVSDYQALIEAENNAKDGEIIGIRGEILIDSKYAVIIGQSFKKNRVTFLRMTEDSCIKIRNTNVVRIRYVKFDGNRDKFPDAVPILQIENSDGIGISYVDFENCSNLSSDGGAVLVKDRTNVDFDNCFFNNNLANNGGHICVKDSACVNMTYTNFVNGEAVNNGGAVYTENEGQLKIKNSVVKENVANELGGGIYNAGSINIDGTIVYANRAKAGADIANENPENMIYQVPDDHFIYENEHIQFVQWISDYDSEVVNAPDSENFLMKMEYKTIQDNQESEENEDEQEPENGNEQGNQGNTDSDEGIADNDNNTAADDSNNNDNTAADSAIDSTPDSTNDSDSSSENQDSSNQENVNEGDSEKNPEDVSVSDSESSNTGDNADTENQEQQNNSNDSQDDNQSENNNQSDNSNQADNEQSEENRQQSDEGQQSNDNQSNSNNQANTENQESNDNQSNDVSGSNNVGQNENTSTNDNSSSGNGQSDSSDNVNQGGVDKGTENTPSIPSNSTNTESEGKNTVEKTDNSITDSKPNEESKAEDSGDKADDKAELNSKPDDNTATDTHDSIKTESKEDTSSTSKPDKVTTPKKTTKVIKTIKATAKKGKKVVSGTTLKKATVKVKIGKKTYKVKSDSKGKYKIKLKSKLKKGTKIKITVSKKGYKTKSKSLKVK